MAETEIAGGSGNPQAIYREFNVAGYDLGFLSERDVLLLTDPIMDRENSIMRVSIFQCASTGIRAMLLNDTASGEDLFYYLKEGDSVMEAINHPFPFVARLRAREAKLMEIEMYEEDINREEAKTNAKLARLKAEQRADTTSSSTSSG